MVCPVSQSLVDNHGLRRTVTVYDTLHGKYLGKELFIIRNPILRNVHHYQLSACCNYDERASFV